MKASTITAIIAFTASAIASPVYKVAPVLRTRDAAVAAARCANAANPGICQSVVETINGWDESVNTVNDFLNRAPLLAGQDLVNLENIALQLALNEPGFLGILKSTPGISPQGLAAATTLGQVFPAVPQNLQGLVQGTVTLTDAINNINTIRCPSILPNISLLWVEAARAAGADTPGFALGPNFCPLLPANVGDGYSLDV
ncbi:hypothetical protein K432DRAFT_343306 [Lepidopterella palustris CBS 459.81]|uniref:Uncharacterized protein n=1 Tax=Lepidopterella palustris CBS 459.81 TaxID=1314670 RepID=A0A8E2JK43_9PEZI|nr:hypothetical protein K432DRAFT_343306 [Lepidopterella palustris CBS 459.81]